LAVSFSAVLDGVSNVEQLAERGGHSARYSHVNPVDDRHLVELRAARCVVVVERGITCLGQVAVQRLPDLFQVVHSLLVGIRAAIKVEKQLGTVRFGGEEIVERQTELLCELPDSRVTLVDQLAAMLGDLSFGEITAPCPAASTESRIG